ncbi:MAG: hypothetical protein ACI9GO_000332, partial [Bacteroidia bacterium]
WKPSRARPATIAGTNKTLANVDLDFINLFMVLN